MSYRAITEDEKKTMGKQLAITVKEKEAVDRERKDQALKFKDRLGDLNGTIAELATTLKRGTIEEPDQMDAFPADPRARKPKPRKAKRNDVGPAAVE